MSALRGLGGRWSLFVGALVFAFGLQTSSWVIFVFMFFYVFFLFKLYIYYILFLVVIVVPCLILLEGAP